MSRRTEVMIVGMFGLLGVAALVLGAVSSAYPAGVGFLLAFGLWSVAVVLGNYWRIGIDDLPRRTHHGGLR